MTKEQEEAINKLERLKNSSILYGDSFGVTIKGFKDLQKDIETVLNMLKEKDKEIEKLRNKNKELLRKLRNRVKEVKKLTKYSLYKKEFSTLNKHIEKKDKIIDLMAGFMLGGLEDFAFNAICKKR